MPSPIGHVLAGLAVGWLAEPATEPRARSASFPRSPNAQPYAGALRRAFTPFALWCACLAAIPDADLLLPFLGHRGATHSVAAAVLIFILAALVTGQVTRRVGWSIAVALAAAYATHLLLDWLGADPNPPSGLRLLWPFDDRFYVSGWDLFPPTDRRLQRPGALAINVRAALSEVAIMGPLAAVALFFRRTRRSRVPISARDVPPPPSGGAADTGGTSDRPALRAER